MFFRLTSRKRLLEGTPPNLNSSGPFLSKRAIVQDDPPDGQAELLSDDGEFRKVKHRTVGGNVQRGWLPVAFLEKAEAAERPPIIVWAFLTTCVRAEEWINSKSDTGENYVNADYLVALALYESKLANIGSETPGTDAVGPFQINSERWAEFISKVNDPEFSADDRDNISDQVYGAAFLTREDTRAISEAVTQHEVSGGTNTTADETGPYIPTYSDVFIAAVVSPMAAIKLRTLQIDGRDDAVISELVDGLSDARKKEMERIFRHNHHILKVDKLEAEARGIAAGPRTVKDLYAVVDKKLDELFKTAFALMKEHVPELLPVASSAASWLPAALREQADPWNDGALTEDAPEGTARVLEYFRTTDLQTDIVLPWCGAFVAFCMSQAGGNVPQSIVKGSARAANWKSWGNLAIPNGTREIPAGAIVVLSPPPGSARSGHVAFYSSNQSDTPPDKIRLLGGNQSDSVKDSDYDRGQIAAIRWLGEPPSGAAGISADDSIPPGEGIAWGRFVDKKFGSSAFKDKVIDIGERIQCDPNYLMAAMAFETGRSFSARQKNLAGGSATGLIQFMPTTAAELGTSTAELAAMTEIRQLDFVETYLRNKARGRAFQRLSDVYMAILWPAAFGESQETAIFRHPTREYRNNRGLDTNGDRTVTVGEATKKVAEQLQIGLQADNRG